jgi:hypothetical protein
MKDGSLKFQEYACVITMGWAKVCTMHSSIGGWKQFLMLSI